MKQRRNASPNDPTENSKPGLLGITTADGFFGKVCKDLELLKKNIADPGAAMNCILSLYHLHEWVWSLWLKRDDEARKKLGIRKKKKEFVGWLERKCLHFNLLQELANGAKHCRRRSSYSTGRVGGWGQGPWDVGPWDMPYLLIDQGADLEAECRYLVASDVLKEIFDFWNKFFDEHKSMLREYQIQDVIARVPCGRVTTYKEIGRQVYGHDHAAQAVGNVISNKTNKMKGWHRVVLSNRKLSGRAPSDQRVRLEREGIDFDPNGRVAEEYLITDMADTPPARSQD